MKNVKKNVIILMLATLAVWATFSCQKDKEEVFENVKNEKIDVKQLADDFSKDLSKYTDEERTKFVKSVNDRYNSLTSDQMLEYFKINISRADSELKSGENNRAFTKQEALKLAEGLVKGAEKQFGKSFNKLTSEEGAKLIDGLLPSEKINGESSLKIALTCPERYYPHPLDYKYANDELCKGAYRGVWDYTRSTKILNLKGGVLVPQSDCDNEMIFLKKGSTIICQTVIAWQFASGKYTVCTPGANFQCAGGMSRNARYDTNVDKTYISVGAGRYDMWFWLAGWRPYHFEVGSCMFDSI
jgi:hypothetical protein